MHFLLWLPSGDLKDYPLRQDFDYGLAKPIAKEGFIIMKDMVFWTDVGPPTYFILYDRTAKENRKWKYNIQKNLSPLFLPLQYILLFLLCL